MYRKFFLSAFFVCIISSLLISAYTLYSQSIRLDESQSIWEATKPVVNILKFSAQDVDAPLYNFILHYWIQFFGTDILVIRTLSMIFLLATLPILFILAKESSDEKVAFLTVALFSLSPFIMWYSTEARTYTLFTFLSSLSNLFFLRILRSNGKKGKAGYFFSTLAGIYTHYFFFLLIFTQAFFTLGRFCYQVYQERGFENFLGRVKKHLTFPLSIFYLLFSCALLFLPWAIYFLKLGAASNTQPLIPKPSSYNIIQTFIVFIFGFQSNSIEAIFVSLWPLLVVLLFFVFTQKRRVSADAIEYFILASFLPISLAFVVSFIKPIFLTRYLIFVTPTLFFIIAWVILNYSKKVSAYLAASLSFLMLFLLIYQSVSAQTSVKEDYQGVDNFLNSHASSSDVIAVTAPFTIYPVEYSYEGSAKLVTIPQWDRFVSGSIPPFTEKNFVSQIQTYQKQFSNIYVVFSYNQGYEQNIRYYLDHHYQLRFDKTFSPGLELREYKLRY